MTRWLVEGLLPAGATLTVTDLDDPDPDVLIARGYDVVLRLHDSGDEKCEAGVPILFTVHWRPGLVPGQEPPPAFWVRFDPTRGLVRVNAPEAA